MGQGRAQDSNLMHDIDTEAGEEYDVLIQDKDFRVIKDPQSHHKYMVQHHCDNPLNTDDLYCDLRRGWYFCWNGEKTCAGCAALVPPEVTGFVTLLTWER